MISTVVEAFRHELQKLHERMDWPCWKESTLSLEVVFSQDKATYKARYTGGNPWTEVRGTDLGKVMDEVYRRLGYEHQAQAAIESSLLALPKPEATYPTILGDDEIPF